MTTSIPLRSPRLVVRSLVALGAGEFSYRITDEASRLNLNANDPVRIDRLLDALRVDRPQREIISDSIQDWRDGNDLNRLHGAESDYYLKLPVPYRARNANIQDEAELLDWDAEKHRQALALAREAGEPAAFGPGEGRAGIHACRGGSGNPAPQARPAGSARGART